MIFPLIYGYFLFGVISAAVTYEMLPERFTVPDGEPALRFLSGLLWPLVGRLQDFLGANATSDPEFCSDNGETCCTYRDGRYCCCTFLYGGLCTCGTTTP